MMLKLWQKILEKGDMRHVRAVLAIYGVATEIKSIHYAEVDEAYRTDDPSKVRDVTPIKMSIVTGKHYVYRDWETLRLS